MIDGLVTRLEAIASHESCLAKLQNLALAKRDYVPRKRARERHCNKQFERECKTMPRSVLTQISVRWLLFDAPGVHMAVIAAGLEAAGTVRPRAWRAGAEPATDLNADNDKAAAPGSGELWVYV